MPIVFGYLRKANFGGACTTTDYLSRVFILHQYRVSLTWPGLVFYSGSISFAARQSWPEGIPERALFYRGIGALAVREEPHTQTEATANQRSEENPRLRL